MILLIAIGLVILRLFYALAEICFERDWPARTWRGLVISLGLLFLCVSAFGQASRVDIPLQTSGSNVPTTSGPLPVALWVSNAKAYVCTHPSVSLAACQANPITTYTDSTGGTPCNAATPLVQLPGSTCTASTGVTSNLGLWYAGGAFDYYISASYGTFGPYTYNVPVSGGTVTGLATIANIAALRTYNGNATSLNVIGYYSASLTSPPDGGGGIFIDQGAGASADDGGVTIYDSVSGHNWKRQIPAAGTIIDAWFGVKADNSTNNAATIQAGWDYMCSARAGKFMFQSGFIRFGSHITKNCTFDLGGTGRNFSGAAYGTNLIYTGTETYAISYDTQRAIFTWQQDSMHDMALSSTEASTTTWTNAIQFTNPNASQLLQGTFERLAFNNWTGAAFYWHVTPFTVPIGTITGYISDGTGSNPGHVLCVTSGSAAGGSRNIVGSGITAGTYIIQDLDSSVALYPATCTGGGGGHPWLITMSANISSETITVGDDTAPYGQAVTMRDIGTSGVGQAIGTDPYPEPELNIFYVENWDHENAQSTSAGVANDFFDLTGFAGLTMTHITYDGSTDASPTMFRLGNAGLWNNLSGIYVETGSAGHPLRNIVETPYGYGAAIELSDVYLGGCTYCSAGSTVVLQPYGGPSTVNFGQNVFGAIGYVDSTKTPKAVLSGLFPLNADTLGTTRSMGGSFRANTTNSYQPVRGDSKDVPFIDCHGCWLDGLTSGIVTVGPTGGSTQAEGMVTDAQEGRVFEIESNNNGNATFNIAFATVPPDLQGEQVVVSVRWKLRTSQSGYWLCPMQLAGGGTAMNTSARSDGSYSFFNCASNSTNTNNAWHTTWFIGQFPAGATASNLAFTGGFGAPSPTGTQFLDISALYISAGNEVPNTLMGGSATQTVNFKCAAAPTYGTYIVGDACANSTPTANGIIRWVNTVAGSPGTFSPVSNNPVSTFGFQTLTSGTATVTNAAACAASATCVYSLTNCATNSSTALGLPTIGTVSAGTSFVINSEGPANTVITADVSKICWRIN